MELTVARFTARTYDRLAKIKKRMHQTNLFRVNQNVTPVK